MPSRGVGEMAESLPLLRGGSGLLPAFWGHLSCRCVAELSRYGPRFSVPAPEFLPRANPCGPWGGLHASVQDRIRAVQGAAGNLAMPLQSRQVKQARDTHFVTGLEEVKLTNTEPHG